MNTIKYLLALIILSFSLAFGSFIGSSQPTEALSGADFNPGRIIDDAVFFNSNAMTPDQIQVFLNERVPVCDTWGTQIYSGSQTRAEWAAANGRPLPPYTCLNDYTQVISGVVNSGSSLCTGSIPGGTRSAAQIIHDVGEACGINPQVLIVMLQKEQGLVTDTWPWPRQYEIAMGYGCPDTAPCASEYYGFFNQVYQAAKAYKRYEANPNSYNYKANRNNFIYYHPSLSACGGSTVYIQNQATANLYIYTPYQPNAAALNNLFGSGDGCSAYGNRNFWRLFSDWFGSTFADDTFSAHPNGTLIALNNKVYKIEDGALRHITHPDILFSYNYTWDDVRPAKIGDNNLPVGEPMNRLAPGTVYRTDGSPVYVVEYENDVVKRQHISFASFNALGYSWDDVLLTTSAITPSVTHSKILTRTAHPSGSIVLDSQVGKVYLIDNGEKRHIINPVAFESHGYKWGEVKNITSLDRQLPNGDELEIRTGTFLLSGGIFVVDDNASGAFKRPVGPWECYADRLGYTSQDWIVTASGFLPRRTGTTYTC